MDGQNFPNTYGANYDKKPVNGFAIAGMVIGILSLVLCCCSEYAGTFRHGYCRLNMWNYSTGT